MRRRGVIILAVALAIAVASLAAAAMLFVAWAHAEAGRRSTERARLNALAWSGVQGAMSELAAQRETLLLGGDPILTAEWTLFEDEGVRGRVRLVPIAGAAAAVSEAAKLDVNTATVEMLSRLPGVGGGVAGGGAAGTEMAGAAGAQEVAEPVSELAKRIVAMRGSGRLPNAEAIGEVEGVTREMLEGKAGGSTPGMGGLRRTEMATPGLLDLLGVFAAEPEASMGVAGAATDGVTRGLDRISIGTAWSDEVREELTPRVSEAALVAMERILSAREKPADESALVSAMLKAGAGPTLVAEVLDTVSFGDDAFRLGRVDLGRATADVLAAVPGIDAASAARVVEERSRLDAETLRRVTWPLERGVLEPEAFARAARWVTTRSVVWRVRIEATLEPMERRGDAESSVDPSGPMAVVEAVIDVSAPRARVAYLRDLTLAGVAREVEVRTVSALEDGEAPPRGAEAQAGESLERAAVVEEPSEPVVEDRAARLARGRRRGETLDPAPGRLAGFSDGAGEGEPARGADASPDDEGGDPVASGAEAASSEPPARRDRRIGRWAPRRP